MSNVLPSMNIWLVGARDGYMPLAFPSAFDQSISVLAIEADGNCQLEQIQLLDGRMPKVATKQLHACVAGALSQRVFEFRRCPFASGMRTLETQFSEWSVFGNGICDYVLSHAHKPIHQSVLKTTTLDVLLAGEANNELPSVLVLDTQGASDEILIDGAEAVLSHVDALVLEVELIPFFGGTPSFARLLPYLWKRGFVFVEFLEEDETWATPFRLPIGQRCRSLPGARDAVFLRLPDHLGQDIDPCRLPNYVTTCAMFSRIDFALESLRRFSIHELCKGLEPCPRESFALALKGAVDQMPTTVPRHWKAPGEKRQAMGHAYIEELSGLTKLNTTPLESVLTSYGFSSLAVDIQSRRIRHASMCLEQESAFTKA